MKSSPLATLLLVNIPGAGMASRAPSHSLVDHLAQELLVLADSGVERIVRFLDCLGLLEADPGKGAGKEGDGHIGSQDSVGICFCRDKSWRRSNS